jgi:hypothetical protein
MAIPIVFKRSAGCSLPYGNFFFARGTFPGKSASVRCRLIAPVESCAGKLSMRREISNEQDILQIDETGHNAYVVRGPSGHDADPGPGQHGPASATTGDASATAATAGDACYTTAGDDAYAATAAGQCGSASNAGQRSAAARRPTGRADEWRSPVAEDD